MDFDQALTIERATQLVGFEPSKYQFGMFEHVVAQVERMAAGKPMKSLIVKAVAGSGKTTSAIAANKLIKATVARFQKKMKRTPRILFLAFNVSIKKELEERLAGTGTEAKTLNGHGHSVLSAFVRAALGKTPNVESSKTWKLMRELISDKDRKLVGGDVAFLVAKCKSLGVAPIITNERDPNFGIIFGLEDKTATDEVLDDIVDHFGREIKPSLRKSVYEYTRLILKAGFDDPTVIDFDDQKYIPVVLAPEGKGSKIAVQPYDVIFVDEAQDVNPTDLALIQMSLRVGGMVVAIGDDRQAIYGFRGADVNSIDNIQKTFGAEVKPLSITYRCGKKIVDHLRTIYEEIEAAPNAIDGEVVQHGKFDHTLFKAWGPTSAPAQRKHIHDMIVCRNNAPLVKMAFRLIRSKVAVHMMGRDFGKDLLGLIQTLVGDKNGVVDGKTTVDLAAALTEWEDNQIKVIRAEKGEEAPVDHITDRAETLRVFIEQNADGKITTVQGQIIALFNTNGSGNEGDKTTIPTTKVILSSGHKSKGLEAKRVFFLDSNLMYPKWNTKDWQMVQEKNLEYVICSRPMEHLGFIYTDMMEG